ncbi:conserved Plasmodium protein, unknown function [Plasmodium relictum]|uniref:LITAF domain-containing protein n=1 Tax=Plasmodium relictum TaxID=85471 RepID=A0A1J1H1R5_PLARL|nr:conserved Plasmodium protein, unknown function [Plasmodium relictum]CRG98604.1 conserved Plasmodium protein, unknown function [Plasmodium relictum]
MKNFDLNGKNKLTEMNILRHEINDLNINDNSYNTNTINEYDNTRVENNLNEAKEVLNCSFCNKHVCPIVEKYTPMFVYIIVILLFLFISFFTIFLLPLLFLTFKQKRYTCPLCKKKLESPEKIFKIKKENQILTFQFPKCAIIISVKYLVLFISLVFLIFLFYIIRKKNDFNLDTLAKGPYIKSSWLDYLEDCGNKSQFRNKFNSIHNFKEKYYGNTVRWRGYFHHIKEGFFNNNSLFIKMNPSEYRYDKPDIRALFNNSLISQIENLQKNDFVEFECTLLEISKNKSSHLCLLWNVILLEKYEPKDFNVVDFIKHLSILDMINNNANPNPFFINLDDKNNNVRRSIRIVHFSNNGFRNSNAIHDKDQYMFNLLNNEINSSNNDNIYIDKMNRGSTFNNKEMEKEDEYDENDINEEDDMNEEGDMYEENSNYDHFNYGDIDEDNSNDNHPHHNEFFDNSEYEKAHNYEREFKEEEHFSSNYELNNKKIDYKKTNTDTNEKLNEEKGQEMNEEKGQEMNEEKSQELNEENIQEMNEEKSQELNEEKIQEMNEEKIQEMNEEKSQEMNEEKSQEMNEETIQEMDKKKGQEINEKTNQKLNKENN